MKVYLVNLDRDKDRLAFADAQLKNLGVAYERVSAVYGKDLSESQKRKAVDGFRWWCAVGRPCMPGEIGCALSHRKVLQTIIDENLPVACVLEDDVVLDARMPKMLKYLESHINSDEPAVYMLSHANQPIESGTFCVESSISALFTDGYVVTSSGARALLSVNYPIETPCDWWARWVRRGVIRLYQCIPTVCRQDFDGFASNTEVSLKVGRVADLSLPLYFVHKVKRLVGKIIDGVLESLVRK